MTIEIPLGWRRLRDGECVIKGDKCNGCSGFELSGNWSSSGRQGLNCKPYIRPLDDQWHEHDGGEMPVNGEEVVACGTDFNFGPAEAFVWTSENHPNPVSRYRRHQPAEQPATLTEPQMTGTTMETPILGTFETGKKVEYTISHDTVFQVENFDGVVRINGETVCDAEHIPALIKALEMLQ